jgi:hypothetical protein
MRKGIKFFCLAVSLAFLSAVLFTGCAKTGITTTTNNAVSYVTLMNLAPYAPSTEVYLNNAKNTSAIAPGNYATIYAHLIPGVYDVKFKKASSDSLLAEIPSSLYDSLKFTTLILYNDTTNGVAKAVKIVDDYVSVTTSDSYYRFFNMSPDVRAVDLYINGTKTQLMRTPADNVTNTYYNSFRSYIPGNYSLAVKKSGTDSTIATLNNLDLLGGNAYTIFLSGMANGTTNTLTLKSLRAAY